MTYLSSQGLLKDTGAPQERHDSAPGDRSVSPKAAFGFHTLKGMLQVDIVSAHLKKRNIRRPPNPPRQPQVPAQGNLQDPSSE